MINRLKNYFTEFIILFKRIPSDFKTTQPFFEQNPVEELKTNPESRQLYEKYFGDKTSFEKIIDSSCGMYCLKMILKSIDDSTLSTVELAKECMDYGGYFLEEDGRLSGMIYIPFSKFIKAKFNLNSEVCNTLSIRRIKYEISKGNFVIASVHWDIKDSKNTPEFKGGHLVVITGYDDTPRPSDTPLERGFFYINNPSGYQNISQVNYGISTESFKKFFSSRGLIIIK